MSVCTECGQVEGAEHECADLKSQLAEAYQKIDSLMEILAELVDEARSSGADATEAADSAERQADKL